MDTSRDKLRYWVKAAECLHARVAVLEEIICSLDGKEHLEKALGGPVCSLEDIAPFSQQHLNMVGLVRHINSSWDHEHRFHRHIMESMYCVQCQQQFPSAKELALHEYRLHGEPLTSRIDAFSKLGKGVPFTQTRRIEQGETSLPPDSSSTMANVSLVTAHFPSMQLSSTQPRKRQKHSGNGNEKSHKEHQSPSSPHNNKDRNLLGTSGHITTSASTGSDMRGCFCQP
ncbi:hypothetical protein CIRG_07643 [Coccidioides immitis RMSCC 2394]|uniref:C2H2-type domain-containing protein n=1 Tax=Coccidioides immitis RMSCC 2394 TaxID=404692 RepID=A0A0J7BD04_COCIT|nr:hypothetical protein CIRG_07643 [Coccidioides immitis RMSCC 2394]